MKEEEVEILTAHLVHLGMERQLAKKNLLECDRYFIEALTNIISRKVNINNSLNV